MVMMFFIYSDLYIRISHICVSELHLLVGYMYLFLLRYV